MGEGRGQDVDWVIERYRSGDERDILELFHIVFGTERSMEHWLWQFKDNPYGGPFATLARRSSDRRLAGHHIVMPFPLNVKGQQVRACHSLDLAVHPDHRGQGVFAATGRDCFEWCSSAGIQFVVAFPNASSYPGFVRTLGWHRILFPNRYVLRLGIGRQVGRVLRLPLAASAADLAYRSMRGVQLSARHALLTKRAGSGVRFGISATVPDPYEALWDAWRSQEVLSVWKDSQYLRWRYDSNPDHDFRYLFLMRGPAMVAVAVMVELEGVAAICELLVGDRDVGLGQLLVSHVCLHAMERGMDKVRFVGFDAGFFDEILHGFDRQVAFENVFCGRAFQDRDLDALGAIAGNWTLTFGDGDFV